ncbi:MAG: nucleoside-diphosphate kinase [bacterium]
MRPKMRPFFGIVHERIDSVNKIGDILGVTDPLKARHGSIRRESGTNIMVNAAPASDSAENTQSEMRLLDVMHDPHFEEIIRSYYA